jgi:hypothetical protein
LGYPYERGFGLKITNLKFLSLFTFLPMKMEQKESSETSAYKIQTPGNYPKENIRHTEHGESWKIVASGW